MSVDGPGVVESDLAHDVYNEILDLYDSGVSGAEIVALMSKIEGELSGDMELEIFLAASTKALWEIGSLDEARRSRLSVLVASGTSLARWGAGPGDSLVRARKAVLQRLLRQTASPRLVPRARQKYAQVKVKMFAVGDCVQMRAKGALYRGVVCDILEQRGRCEYAILIMSPSASASLESFTAGEYYGHRIPSVCHESGFVLGPTVIRLEHRMLVQAKKPFDVLGRVRLDSSKYTPGSWGGVVDMSGVIREFERVQATPEGVRQHLLPLKELLMEGGEAET